VFKRASALGRYQDERVCNLLGERWRRGFSLENERLLTRSITSPSLPFEKSREI